MFTAQSLEKLLRDEIIQRREEGCNVTSIEEKLAAIAASDAPDKSRLYEKLYRQLERRKPRKGLASQESSDLEGIRALRPEGPRRVALDLDDDLLHDRLLGAWLGRAAGCLLGKPCEGWTREKIEAYLKLADAFPLDDYWPIAPDETDELKLGEHVKPTMTRGNITAMERDDDMDYTVLGLHVLEEFGPGFTPKNVAETWLTRLPYHLTYTAEHVAYRNFVMEVWPPESATCVNPYREWIGAPTASATPRRATWNSPRGSPGATRPSRTSRTASTVRCSSPR